MDLDFDVVIVGGGVCGVLAAQRLSEENFSYLLIEKLEDYGGVWAYRANEYSHLQAHAALYQWHPEYRLDAFPFKKCSAATVLGTLRRFATEHGLRQHTNFRTEVTDVREQGSTFLLQVNNLVSGQARTIKAGAVFVCSGILGKQLAPEERDMPGLERYQGQLMYAGKTSDANNHLLGREAARDKDVVILGSGAFGLEAMEAAHRADAKSITLVTKRRERWIMPYSQQFKFIFLSHAPFLPRRLKCFLMHWWLSALYRKCGISYMAPPDTTPQSFTGQCNDAFFQYPKKRIATYVIGEVEGAEGRTIELRDRSRLDADILVVALGHEVQKHPAFLSSLNIGYTEDLHNFAFLGRNPRLGAASDWVWFNVPHGPQKQINSFVCALKACRDGKSKDVRSALLPTPFVGCKGEPLNHRHPSGLTVAVILKAPVNMPAPPFAAHDDAER